MADIVLDVGFNQTEVDKEIDKIEKKLKGYNKTLSESEKILDNLEKQYDTIKAQLEIEKNLRGENSREVKALQLELDVVKDKLNAEYAIMDRIKEKTEETKKLRREAYLEPEKFLDGISNYSINPISDTSKLKDTKNIIKQVNNETSRLRNTLENTTSVFSNFVSGLLRLAKNVFVFSVITSALRGLRNHINGVISSDNQLSASLNTIKLNLQSAFMPIYQAVLPALQTLMYWLAKATSYIATFINTLFGKSVKASRQAVQALNNQAKSTKGLATETKKANKEMNKQLAGFDELNVLSKEVADNFDDLGGGGSRDDGYSPKPIIDFDTSDAEKKANEFKEKLAPIIVSIRDSLADSFNKFKDRVDFKPLLDSFNKLKESLKPFLGHIGEGLKWFLDDILVPLGAFIINDAVPAFLNLLSGALDFLDPIIVAVKDSLSWLWDNFLKPIAEWTGGVICDTLNKVADSLSSIGEWMSEHQEIINDIALAVTGFAIAWGLVTAAVTLWNAVGAIATVVTGAFAAVVAVLTSPITLVILAIGALIAIVFLLIKHWDEVKECASKCWDWIVDVWKKAGDWFKDKVVEPTKNFFKGLWDGIKNIFTSVPEWFKNKFKSACDAIKAVFSSIGSFFSGIWDKIKSTFTNIGTNVGNAIGSAFSKVVNSIISFAERIINKFISDIDFAISLINKIPGVNIPVIPKVSLPRIPYLAQGAVIPPNKEFLAVLGDQKNGTNIEAPLDTIKQALAEVLAQNNSNVQEYTFIAQLDGRTLFSETVRQDHMYKKQSGKSAFAY